MESQSVFQAKIQAKMFSIELPPCCLAQIFCQALWGQTQFAPSDAVVDVLWGVHSYGQFTIALRFECIFPSFRPEYYILKIEYIITYWQILRFNWQWRCVQHCFDTLTVALNWEWVKMQIWWKGEKYTKEGMHKVSVSLQVIKFLANQLTVSYSKMTGITRWRCNSYI